MNTIIMKAMLVGVFIMTLCSCQKEGDEYYCYLVEKDWPDADTLSTYDEAFWFYKKKSKPQDECLVDRAELIIENQWNPNYTCVCVCGWE